MSDQIKPLFTWRSAMCASGLGASTKHVALALALWMNEMGGSAYPGPSLLAAATSLHVSTVKEKLAELEAEGWLVCVERGGIRGEKRRANMYEAVIPQTALPFGFDDPSPLATRRAQRGDPSCSARRPVAQDDPITSMNSSRNSRARAIPDPFDVTPEMIEWAQREHPTVDWTSETRKFLDHFRANGKPMKDWGATWRNWIRRSVDFAR